MSDYVIETRGLTKTYGEQNSVSNLSIHVRKGRIYGLLGRNGAGKTTTMRMLLGLTAPSSGDVKIFGKPLRGNEKNILPRIGSLIESPGFYPNLTGTENLRIFADLRGLKSPKYIKGALEVVNLPYRDKKLFSQYSLGMKQRLAIAVGGSKGFLPRRPVGKCRAANRRHAKYGTRKRILARLVLFLDGELNRIVDGLDGNFAVFDAHRAIFKRGALGIHLIDGAIGIHHERKRTLDLLVASRRRCLP